MRGEMIQKLPINLIRHIDNLLIRLEYMHEHWILLSVDLIKGMYYVMNSHNNLLMVLSYPE